MPAPGAALVKEEANVMLYKNSPAKSEGSAGARRRGITVIANRFRGHSGSPDIPRGSERSWFTRHTALALLADMIGVFLFLGGISTQDVFTGVLGITVMALGILVISGQGPAPRRCPGCPPQG
ncbi:hypothetical protein [Arthrobacter globiformis]|uniref:hypothetical protein n=1 Tax=Arthrobacter globiformis TaxID=1665 RepID=UPI00277EE0C2|nr:hypothetical protein [Arthrobacter globiformis]MDQ0867510.1 hypothetical protein [Arthrobacter globiformis]